MATAKKLITAQLDLSAVQEFKGDLTEALTKFNSPEQIQNYLSERYSSNDIGELSIHLNDHIASFKWILPNVDLNAEKLHQQALEKAREKQYNEAITFWIKAISLNAKDPDYYFNTGIAYFEEKNYQESIENLEQTLKICPIYHKARLILGTVYLKLRKFDKAEYHLKESIYFNPQNPLAILNLGAVFSIQKRYEEGVFAFQRVIELVPSEPRAYFGLGKIYSLQGKIKQANECFHKTIELDKKGLLTQHAKRAIVAEETAISLNLKNGDTSAAAKERLDEKQLEAAFAEAYKAYLFGDYQLAIELYRKYLEHKPKDDYVWFALGESFLRKGQPKEAAAAFKQAIKVSPNKALYHKQLAVAYDYLELPEKAIECAEQALRFGKKDTVVYTILGKNLLKQNIILDAIEKLEAALKLNKTNLNAEYHLALAYMRNQDFDSAIDHLHWIMNAKIKTPLKMQAEALLQKINA
ncbi:MAG: tetratricopeptide repeat protein [candidate division KSB1 bacterium]|nr:tetratricopeptide repeat protein [candidate division KSB1 bacterium]